MPETDYKHATREFTRKAGKKHSVRFSEDISHNGDPIFGDVYVKNWFGEKVNRLRVTVEVID